MTRWLSSEEQRAWRAWRRMTLLVDAAIARELTHDSGLSMPDYQVLSALSEASDHRRRLTELALRMQWSASRLSHHVTRMEQRGLVSRADCSEDLRAAYVVLTETGWEAIRQAAPHHVASVRAHLVDLLTPEEIGALTSIGEKVAAHFGEGCVDQPAPTDAPAPTDGPGQPAPAGGPGPGQPAPADAPGQSAKRSPVSRS